MDNQRELTKDEMIMMLINMLKDNGMKEKSNSMYEMAAYIDILERKLDAMSEELNEVSNKLMEMSEKDISDKVKETVRNSVHKGKERIADIKVKVSEIKADIRTKAISIVNDVKLKGMSALNRVAEMTGIKWKLKSLDEKIKGGIADTEQTIARIENFTAGMKIANAQFANSFRALVGKDDKELVDADKKGLVTKLLTGPWKWQKNVYEGMCRNIEGMIKRIDNLSMEVRSRDAGRSVEAEAVDTVEMDYEDIEIIEPRDSMMKVAEEDKYEVVVKNGKGR